jgi:D,D-heptose 1,7-bisphosphate phosphatase
MKAIFFDRDGVLIDNSKHYYIYRVKDIEFVDGVFENLKLLKSQGFSFFIVTNQGGIAKKQYGHKEVSQVHQYLKDEFEKYDISFKDIYYCPHHHTIEACICRKPSSLMIEKLMAKYEIEPKNALFIGDQDTDMQATQSAGIKGIKITPNQNMNSFIQELLSP